MLKILFLSGVLAIAGCQPQEAKDWSINNPLDGFAAQTSLTSFYWKEGDVVSMYSESELGAFKASYVSQREGQTTSFVPYAYSTVAAKADKFYACYPADIMDFANGSGELPGEYDCSDAAFRLIPQSLVKYNEATGTPGTLNFKPCVNIVEVTVTSSEPIEVKSIELSSDVCLSGTGATCIADKVTPYIKITNGRNNVKFNYENVVVDGQKVFSAVIPANIKLSELKIAVELASGKVIKKTFGGFEAGIGEVYSYTLGNPVVYSQMVYESDTYTSFVDLVWYNDRYYCAFRDGETHVPQSVNEKFGEIRILESADCRTWKEALLLTDGKYDMRDPHFCIAQDGSLLCYYAYHYPENAWVEPSKTIVSVLKQNGGKLVEESRHNVDAGSVYSHYWVWNITRSGDKIYGVGYYKNGTNVAFLVSDDGINFSFVSEIPFLGNESSVNIIDGKAYVLMRSQKDVANAVMAVADAPYTNWTLTTMNYGMHSPVGVEYNGKLYLCGRKYQNGARDGVSLFSYNLPADDKLTELYRLPNDKPAGDNAYPGLCIHDDALRIVYYGIPTGKFVPDIYYYEIPLELLAEASGGGTQEEEGDETLRILAIGNSFSTDAVEQELYPILEAAGKKAIIGNMYIGSCTLKMHADNATSNAASYSYHKIVNGIMTTVDGYTLSAAISDEPWDYISVQEGGGWHGYYDTTYKSFSHSMEPDLTNLIEYINTNKKSSCKIVYHAPWAGQKGYTGTKFSYYDYDQALMYSMICDATKQVVTAHPEIDVVMNSMDAIQNARSSYIGDDMNRDGWHLNYTTGRYTVGCLWAEKILGTSIVGNSYFPESMTAYSAEVCQNAAHEAVLHPYVVTDLSKYTAK